MYSDSYSRSTLGSFREALILEEDDVHHNEDVSYPVVPIHRLRYREYQKYYTKLKEAREKEINNLTNNSLSYNSDPLRLSNSSFSSYSSTGDSFSYNYSNPNTPNIRQNGHNNNNNNNNPNKKFMEVNDFNQFEDEVEGDYCVSNLPNLFSNSIFLNDPWHNENYFYENFEKTSDGLLKNLSNNNSNNNLSSSNSTNTLSSINTLHNPLNSTANNPISNVNTIFQEKDWRLKDKIKTLGAILAMCLNPGIDPPDLIRPNPSSKLICWKDPMSYQKSEAITIIGESLQNQYEKLQSKIKFKLCLDPIHEDLKRCCHNVRKLVKNDRVLFHYNGHGVPKPTANGEFWVFGKHYTHYNPIAVCELKEWLGSPSLFVLDCSKAGILIPYLIKENNNYPEKSLDNYFTSANLNSTNENIGNVSSMMSINNPTSFNTFNFSQNIPPIQINNNPSSDPENNLPVLVLAACRANENLPYHPSYPTDIFSSCLTTPTYLCMRWFLLQNSHLMKNVSLSLCDIIPGKEADRRSPRGEINWILTTITDTIAWNVFSDEQSNQFSNNLRNKKIFQKLFRKDLLVASLFRNFLVAQRIMKSFGCTPQSYPPIPDTSSNSLWLTWDLTLESFLTHYNNLIIGNPMIYKKNNMSFIEDIPLESIDPSFLENASHPNLSFFNDQLRSFEIWLDFNNNVELISMPDQLPVILQVLLSHSHRIIALKLLKRFLALGDEAVRLSLIIGIYPYILKLLLNSSSEVLSLLISIWAAVVAYDPSCIQELVREKLSQTFVRPLVNNDANYSYSQSVRSMCLFILTEICTYSIEGQQQCLSAGLHRYCAKIIDEFSPEVNSTNSSNTTSQNNSNNNSSNNLKASINQHLNPENYSFDNLDFKNTSQINEAFNYIQNKNSTIKLWACLASTRLCQNNLTAKYQIINESCHIKLQNLLSDSDPSIRAAACLALGELFGASAYLNTSFRNSTGSFSNLNFRDPSGSFNDTSFSNSTINHGSSGNLLQNSYRYSFSSNSDDGCSLSLNSGVNLYEELREYEMLIATNILECLTDGSVMVRYEALVAISKMFLSSFHFDCLNLTAKYVLIKTHEKQLHSNSSNLTKSSSLNSAPTTTETISDRRNRSYSESLKNLSSSSTRNQNQIIYPWLLSPIDTKEIIKEIENYIKINQASNNNSFFPQILNRTSRGCSIGSINNINNPPSTLSLNTMGVINENSTEDSVDISKESTNTDSSLTGSYLQQFKEDSMNNNIFTFNLGSTSNDNIDSNVNNANASVNSNSSQSYSSILASGYFKIWVSLVEVGTRDPHHVLTQSASILTARIHARLALKEKRKLKDKSGSNSNVSLLSETKSSTSLWRSKSGSISGSNLVANLPTATNLKSSTSSSSLSQFSNTKPSASDLNSPTGVATEGNFSFLNAPLTSSSASASSSFTTPIFTPTFTSTPNSSSTTLNLMDQKMKKNVSNETILFPNLGFPSNASSGLSITTDFSALNNAPDQEISPTNKSKNFHVSFNDFTSAINSGSNNNNNINNNNSSLNANHFIPNLGSNLTPNTSISDFNILSRQTSYSNTSHSVFPPSPLLNSAGKSIFQELLKDDFFHLFDDEDDFNQANAEGDFLNNFINQINEDDYINNNYPILQVKSLKSNFYDCFKKLFLLPDLQFDYYDDPLSIHSSIRNYRNNKLYELVLMENFYRTTLFKDIYEEASYGIVDRKAITKLEDVGLNINSSFSAEKDTNSNIPNSNPSNLISTNSVFKFEQKCTFAADGQNLNNSLVMFHSFQDLIVVASDSIASIWSISANCKIAEIKNKTKSLLKYPTLNNSSTSTPLTSANPYTSFASLGSNYHQYLHHSFDSSRSGTPSKSKSHTQIEFNTTKITSMCWINESYNPLLLLGSDDGVIKIWKDSSTSPPSILSEKPTSNTMIIGGYNHSFNQTFSSSTTTMASPSTPMNKPQSVGAIELSSSFCALPDIVSTSLGSGLISSWQQTAGTLVVGGNSSTIRLWDLGREQLVRVFNTGRETCLTSMATSSVSSYNSSTVSALASNNPSTTSALASLFQSMNMGGVGGASGGGIGTGSYFSSDYHNFDMSSELVDDSNNFNSSLPSFSPLTWTIAGFADGYTSIYDERVQSRGGLVTELKLHSKWINCIHLRNDVSEVITGSINGEIKFTDLRMMRTYRTLATNKTSSNSSTGSSNDSHSSMRSLVVHPCAPIIAFGTNDLIRMTSLSGEPLGQAIKYYDGFLGQRIGPVSSLAFHPRKLLLAVSSSDGIVSVFGPSDRVLQGIDEQIYF